MIHISPPQVPRTRYSLPRFSSCPKALHPTAAATGKPHNAPILAVISSNAACFFAIRPLQCDSCMPQQNFGHVCCSCCHGTALMLCLQHYPYKHSRWKHACSCIPSSGVDRSCSSAILLVWYITRSTKPFRDRASRWCAETLHKIPLTLCFPLRMTMREE